MFIEFVLKFLIDCGIFLLKLLYVYVLSFISSNYEVYVCNILIEDFGICLDFFYIEVYLYFVYKIFEINLLIERVKLFYFVFKYVM